MQQKQIESRAFLLLVLLITVAFVWIVRDFLMPVFWAIVFAVVFRPIHRRILNSLGGRRNLASVLTTLVAILVILIPTGLIGLAVTQQAIDLYERVSSGDLDVSAPLGFIERTLPAVADLLARFGIESGSMQTALESAAMSASRVIAAQALAFGQSAILFAGLFVLMLYFLFFFLRDSERILEWIIGALPLGDERERRLFAKFAEVSRATMKGTLVVAAVQGALGGGLFAIVGINSAVFWGVVMGFLSLLPIVGTGLVWLPAGIYLLVTGSIWQGLFVLVGGTVVVGLADNVLRPILVGHDTKMPDYLVLLATLGGLAVFGLSGVVLGPLVGAMFLVLWDMMAEEYSSQKYPGASSESLTSS